jgi:hypothetical protein
MIDSKIKIEAVNQIAIVVKNIDEVVEKYWTKLAIGPWDLFDIKSPDHFKGSYKEKTAGFGYKYGVCQVGSCSLKLIQPTAGESIFSSFIDKNGEGIHHIYYNTDSIEKAEQYVKLFHDQDFTILMEEKSEDSYQAYIDTVKTFGCIISLGRQPVSLPATGYSFPSDKNSISPAKLKIDSIAQIGIIVNDLSETIKNYWNILGIGPWGMVGCKPPLIHDLTYKGKPGDFTSKVGYADVGGVEVEPIEPISGINMYQDFLDMYGQGPQHLQFIVKDSEETKKIMSETGYPNLMSLGFSDGEAVYYDTFPELKAVWESFQLPKKMPEIEKYP